MRIMMIGMDSTTYFRVVDGQKVFSRSAEVAIAESIARQGHEVMLVCERIPHFAEGEKPENLWLVALPVNQTVDYEQTDGLLEFGPEVVFATSISGARLGNWVAKKLGVKSVVQVLDVPRFRLGDVFPRAGFTAWRDQWDGYFKELQCCDVIVANTKATVKAIKEETGRDSELVYYGMDTDLADRTPEQDAQWDVSFVSRHVFYKGAEQLLFALSILKEDGGIEPSVAIMGAGEETSRLLQIREMLGLKGVEFLGPVPNEQKFEVIKASRIGVIPEYCESIGSVAPMEYIYCKRPVLCWDLEIHKDRFSVWPRFVTRFDVASLASQIKGLLGGGILIPQKQLEDGKEWILQNRSFHSTTAELIKVLGAAR